jgi:hypothetical protein
MPVVESFHWPASIEAAVSLTYDDGLPIHHALVAPTLEQHGMRGTFYAPVLSDIRTHPETWQRLAAAGHELGNHTVFHPCRRDPAEQYAWLDPAYDLQRYTPQRLRSELEVANFVLWLLDGRTDRTLGTTCCHTTIGQGAHEQPIAPIIPDLFVAARGAITRHPVVPGPDLDLLDLGCVSGDGRSLSELQALVAEAREQRGWLVLMMHGVGADSHDLHVDHAVHQRFIAWLAGQPSVWVAPVREIATYVRHQRASR